MPQIKKEIIINAPVKKVWKIFSDIEKWPELSDYISKAYWTTSKKWTLESSFTQVIVNIIPFMKSVSHTRFIKIIPAKIVTWTGTRPLIRGIHTLKFENIDNKTRVINLEYFKGPLAPFIFPFIKNKFEHYFEQFLIGLKAEAEKQ